MGAGRRLLLVLGVATVALLALEGLARLLAPALPAPTLWADDATAVKIAQMEARSCADVVFVGNSTARDGFDPSTFTATDPEHRSAYNAALDAATPGQLRPWLTDQVLPRLHPRVVVWAIGSPDLNAHAPAGRAARDAYLTSIGGRQDLLGRAQRVLVDHVALARHRDALRRPAAVWAAIGDRLAGVTADRPSAGDLAGVLGPDGVGRSRRDLTYTPDDPVVAAFVRDQLLSGFTVGTDEVADAQATVRTLQDRGIAVVLVTLPVTDEFVALHPHGAADWEEYRAAMASLAATTGAPLVDLSVASGASDDRFADTHHLNGAGAVGATRALSDQLAGMDLAGATSPCPGGDR